ncbi:MAG: hypothetical protein KJO35_09090 [Gammaproteobacteria bacterium]|nr:hypothetical protein [Gammaproteobacteria bacterium]NNF66605.1 hypothetical protein [Gammaproteobacteria bacterium]
MAILLFRLRGVPDDEAQDVRDLLTAHNIDHYETPAGNWGISMPSLWLRDESQRDRAKALIKDYQEQRASTAREQLAQAKREGNNRTLLDEFKDHPIRFTAIILFVLLILYLSTKPFLALST